MADVAPSPLTFRDFLYYTLPTAIAICLFAPLYNPLRDKISIESLILSAVILGYLVSTPVIKLASKLYNKLPILSARLADYKKKMEWSKRNWDYDRLFYFISNEEREYLYLTRSYADFYRLVSFYLIIYSIINISRLVDVAWVARGDVGKMMQGVISATTPLPKDAAMPTWLLLLASMILSYYALKEFFNEYRILFHDKGQYTTFAEKYHKANGGIAVSVWGKVHHNGLPHKGVEVELIGKDNSSLGKETTDSDGHFQFYRKYSACSGGSCKLQVRAGDKSEDQQITPTDKTVPYYEVNVSFPPVAQPASQSLRRGLRISGAVCCGILVIIFILLTAFEGNSYYRAAYVISAVLMIVCFVGYLIGKAGTVNLCVVSTTIIMLGTSTLLWSTTNFLLGAIALIIFIILRHCLQK
jgi:hypothetical protein